MQLRQLQHFVVAAKAEHVTRTAVWFNIIRLALVSLIRSLEEELGEQLFLRKTRSVRFDGGGPVDFDKGRVCR